MSRKSTRRNLTIGSGLIGLALVFLVVFSGPIDLTGVGGTMGGAASPSVESVSGAWDVAGTGGRTGRLDHSFKAVLDVQNPTAAVMRGDYELVFSRDPEFDDVDCVVDTRSIDIAAGGRSTVQFEREVHAAACVDAGFWYAAIHDRTADIWHEVSGRFEVESGAYRVRVQEDRVELGHAESFDVDLIVERPATDMGTLGLFEVPATLWLSQDDELCAVDASAITLERDPVRRVDGAWSTSRITMSIDPEKLERVRLGRRAASPLDGDATLCEECGERQRAGSCKWQEGVWSVAAGPAPGGVQSIGTVHVNAPPIRVADDPVELVIAQGEIARFERQITNPGSRAVQWSAQLVDAVGARWLVGMENQTVRAGKRGSAEFTVNAADLEPGVYSGTILFEADDYYATAVRIPIDVRVEGRSIDRDETVADASFELSNYPNPFRGRTTLVVSLETAGAARLAVYDLQGREIRVVHDGYLSEGRSEFAFDADALPAGTYLYRVTTPGGARSSTLTLVR